MSKLLDKILKNSTTKLTSVLSESVMFKDKDIIPIDVPLLNIAFSGDLDGGLASGLTLLAGPSKSFKSLMSLIMVRAYMNKYPDAVCILYDSEGGMTPQYLSEMGVDTARVVHVPIEHLEMLKFDTVKQLSELSRGDHVIMVIDSIGNTASQKELVDALDEKSVAEMQRAKSIKGLFRMITPSLVIKDIPCICICHTYATLEMFCLDGDTQIRTAEGLVALKNISVGDMVWAKDSLKRVTNKYTPEDLPTAGVRYLKMTFDDGTSVKCTNTHRFLMQDDTWVAAGDIKIGDEFK